jgi:hypothetical protein
VANQQLVGAQFTVSRGQHEFAVHMGDLAGLRVLQHLDALGTESGCHGLADGRVFAEEQVLRARIVTLLPSRAKACASSSATTDEPITARRSGMVSLTSASVEVQ